MENKIKDIIADFKPEGWPVSLGETRFVQQYGNEQVISLNLPFPQPSLVNQLAEYLQVDISDIHCNFNIAKMKSCNKVASHPKIKNIIAVSSGKGGVGKSTVAVELALALKNMGCKVGILDADVHGPSVPSLLGITQHEMTSVDGRLMDPTSAMGLVANSIGFLVDANDATIWRGPMASKVLMQLYQETNWPELDYLIVDMPPGTSDIQLTLAQSLPVTAAIVVTTPQKLAILDAKKGVAMFNKVNLSVLGIVENMSYLDCDCGTRHYPFGQKGVNELLSSTGLLNLGTLPIFADTELCGKAEYKQIAENVASALWFKGQVAEDVINLKQL